MNASIYSTNGKMAYQMDSNLIDGVKPHRILVTPGKPNRREYFANGKWNSMACHGAKKFIAQVIAELKD